MSNQAVKVALVATLLLFALSGCGNQPTVGTPTAEPSAFAATPATPAPEVVFVPVASPGVLAITIGPTGLGCDFVCEAFPNGAIFCDSDCDGWFDDVEIEFGYNPCNPAEPPIVPTNGGASVCADVASILAFPKTRTPDLSVTLAVVAAQREELR